MAVGDFGGTPLVAQAQVTGGWTAISAIGFWPGLCHVRDDIYAIGFGHQRASDSHWAITLATVRVTGAGVITAASLDSVTVLAFSSTAGATIELHKLDTGVVAAFFSKLDATIGLQLATYTIAADGTITLADGPDALDGSTAIGASGGGPRANKVGDGIWAVIYEGGGNRKFVSVSLSDAGVIGAVLDGPDDTGDLGRHNGWIQLDGNVAINIFSPATGDATAETFSCNESTGIFDISTQLDAEAAISVPQGANSIVHVDPTTPSNREVVALGDTNSAASGTGGLVSLSINGSNVITNEDSVDIANTDGEEQLRLIAIGDRKVLLLGAGDRDTAFTYAVSGAGALSLHDSASTIGITNWYSSPSLAYLRGSGGFRMLVMGMDVIDNEPRLVVLAVESDLDEGSQNAIFHGTNF